MQMSFMQTAHLRSVDRSGPVILNVARTALKSLATSKRLWRSIGGKPSSESPCLLYNDLMSFYQFKGKKVNLEELTAELRKMMDIELLKFTEALERRHQQGDLELRNEARAEWNRRHLTK